MARLVDRDLAELPKPELRVPRGRLAARENFSVPLWAGITAEQQERVVDVVRDAVGVASRA